MTGKLIGVGLGPGDPELMTLKAHRLITGAAVVAYPALENGESFARAIAAAAIPAAAAAAAVVCPSLDCACTAARHRVSEPPLFGLSRQLAALLANLPLVPSHLLACAAALQGRSG